MELTRYASLLDQLSCDYAFYYRRAGRAAVFQANAARFSSASLIKVPILLAWIELERQGLLDRAELCCLDDEPQVQGAGFSWLLHSRRLPYQDVLLLMISLSDNLATNLVVQKIGLERLNRVFREGLGLEETQLQRKLMDFEARAAGRDNWIGAQDCIRLFELFRALQPEEKAWAAPMLLANQDTSLLLRDVPRDTLDFYHKSGSIPGVLHDWGFTAGAEIFLLTQHLTDEPAANQVFGQIGRLLLEED